MSRSRNKIILYCLCSFVFFLLTPMYSMAAICQNQETGIEYNTLQAALDGASARNHIVIYPGTYTGTGNVALSWPAVQDISLVGNSTSPGPIAVFIDALSTTRHIVCNYDVRFKLTNIAFLNGKASTADAGDNSGGFLYTVENNSSLVISLDNCIISGNTAYNGGVIYSGASTVVSMNNCIVQGNFAAYGGVFYSGTHFIKNTTLNMNTATVNGGVFYQGTNRLINTLVYSSGASSGGVFYDGSNQLYNCTFVKNVPQIYFDSSLLGGVNGELTAYNTIFSGTFNGGNPSYFSTCSLNFCAFTEESLTGNPVTKRPIFSFDNNTFSDYANDIYTLASICPAINMGSNYDWALNSANISTDLTGKARIIAGAVDMGAYESDTMTTQNCMNFESGQIYGAIQNALDNAHAGDHIYVYPGTHKGAGNVGLVWPDVDNITLMADPALGTSANVILDAEGATRNIYQQHAVTWMVSNLSLINGKVSMLSSGSNKGGAIFINVDNSLHHLTLTACKVSSSSAYAGGAIYSAPNSSLVVSASMLTHNHSNSSGGVFYDGTNTIVNSAFRNNSALLEGGVFYSGTNTLTDNTMDANQADQGAVFRLGTNRLDGCLLLNNTEATKGSVFNEGENYVYNSVISNNVSVDQGAVFYLGHNTLINCLIVSNNAVNSGGVFFEGNNSLLNCTLVKNLPDIYYDNDSRGGIYGQLNASNTILYGNFQGGNDTFFTTCVLSASVVTGSVLPASVVSTHLIVTFNQTDFCDYSNNNFALTTSSVAVNSGSNDLWAANADTVTSDLFGAARIIDSIDIGAIELQQYITLPATPIITPITSPTNNRTIYFTGTRSLNAVTINMVCATAASLNSVLYPDSSSWAVTVNGLAEGTNNITVNAFNSLGVSSGYATINVFVDTIAPLKPVFDTVLIVTNNPTVVLRGVRSADSVSILVMVPSGTAQTGLDYPSSNRWTFSVSSLVQGENLITINALDNAGNMSAPATMSIVFDTNTPAKPVIASMNNLVSSNFIAITGTCSTDSLLVVVTCSSATSINPVIYPVSGSWQTTINGVAQGTNNITVYALDSAGNASEVASVDVYVDSLAPATPSITTALSPTAATTLLLKGGKSADTITLSIECATIAPFNLPQLTAATSWQVTLNNLVLGIHLITVNAFDAQGIRSFVTASLYIQPSVNVPATSSVSFVFVSDPFTEQGWSTGNAVIKRNLGANTSAKMILSSSQLGIDFSEDYLGIIITSNALGFPMITVPIANGTFGSYINNQSGAVSVPLVFKLNSSQRPMITVDIGQGQKTISKWDGSEKSNLPSSYQARVTSFNFYASTLNFSVTKFSSYSVSRLATIDVAVSSNRVYPMDITTINLHLTDTSGDGIEGAPVSINIVKGGGTLSATTITTDANGDFVLQFQAPSSATLSLFSVSCDGLSNTSLLITTLPFALTAPLLSSDLTPTRATTFRINGTKNAFVSTVNVECTAAESISPVLYPSSTSWTTTLNNLAQGTNILSLNGVNFLGENSTTRLSSFIVDYTTPSIGAVKSDGVDLETNVALDDQPMFSFTTTDNLGVSSVNIYLDDTLHTQLPVSGVFCRTDVRVHSVLTPGAHTLKIELLDKANNQVQKLYGFSVSETLELIGRVLNYPNPFDPKARTSIVYYLTKDADITLHVTDIVGRKVVEMHYDKGNNGAKAGKNLIDWNCWDFWGNPISSGYYLLQVYSAGKLLGKCKMVAVK